MKLIDFFKGLFGVKSRFTLDGSPPWDEAAAEAYRETAVQRIALSSAVGMIANTVSKCEFKTFVRGGETRGDEYYLWNVRPNANESSSAFLQKLVYRLYADNECLVIFNRDNDRGVEEAFVADTFALEREYAFKPNIYGGVSVNNLALNRSFTADEVLHFKLNNENVRMLLEMFYGSYKKLVEMSLKAFSRSRGEQGVLETTRLPGNVDYEETLRKMKQKYFDPYFASDNTVLPLFEGQKYTKINNSGQRELADVGDTRKLFEDIFDVTARALRIPPALLRGEMADTNVLMTNYLTFCIDPLCRSLADEINAKRYRRGNFLGGSCVKIDTSCVKHYDILDAATAIDKLISSGTVNVNELRAAIDMPAVSEDWAARHFITKNYAPIESLNAIDEGR